MPYTWDPQRLWIKDDISTFTTLAAERSIGMSVVPVPGYTGVIPDISRPFLIKVRAILRIDVDDLPADGCVLLMCLADAGTAVRTMFDTDEMGLFPLAEIGNLDGEMSAYIEHEYDEHSPGTKQVCGCSRQHESWSVRQPSHHDADGRRIMGANPHVRLRDLRERHE